MKIAIKREQNSNLFEILSSVSNSREAKIAIKREQNPNLFEILSSVSHLHEVNLREAKKIYCELISGACNIWKSKFLRKMRIVTFLLLISITQAFAWESYAQTKQLSLNLRNETILNILNRIEDQSEFYFMFDATIVDVNQRKSINCDNQPITAILDQLLKDTKIVYEISDRQIVLTSAQKADVGQSKTVSGRVTDPSGSPLPGVTVVVKGTTRGIITNSDGSYTIPNVPPDGTLVFSFVGMKTQEIEVAGKTTINVTLLEETVGIEEVVAIGYGTQKKVNLTGAISSVQGEVLLKAPATNLSNVLVGRLPGLIAVQGNGKPGSSSSISIRGASTIGDNSALIIVDGLVRDFQNIDPNEVESLTILKDASATAVYGSRAANGVILVTTKRGALGKPVFSYNGFGGIQQPTVYPRLMNGYEYATTKNQARENMGLSPEYTDQQLEDIRKGNVPKTDWYDETLNKHAFQMQHNMNVSGGTEAVKYFLSLGYLNQNGLFDKLNYKRYSVRSNIDASLSRNLTVAVDIDASTRKANGSSFSPEMIFHDIITAYPLDVPFNPDGTISYTREQNPVADIEAGYNNTTYNILQTTLSFEQVLPFIKGLSVRGKASFGKESSTNKNYMQTVFMHRYDDQGNLIELYPYGGWNGKIGLRQGYDEYVTTTLNASIHYSRTFGDHEVAGMALFEQFDADATNFYAFRTNFAASGLDELFYGGESQKDGNGSSFNDGRRSYVMRGNYNYKQKYLLEASFRVDGSVAFPTSKKYGFFPAVSAGWRISEEAFMKNSSTLDYITYLKLRASYGVVGNDRNVYSGRIPTFQYKQVFNPSSSIVSGNSALSSITPGVLPNPNVTWESAAIFDVGLDGSLWNDRLQFETDFFYKRTSDILLNRIRSIPGTLGAQLPAENYAEVDNKGFEISLTHNNKIGALTYFVSVNGSYSKNKVITLDEPANIPDYLLQTGRPMGFITGYKALGLFQSDQEVADYYPQFNGGQKAGDIKYADITGDKKVDSNDQTIISMDNSTPKVIGSLSFGGRYKNFDLSVLFQGATKVKKLLSIYSSTFFNGGSQNSFAELLDYWTPDNRDARYPRPWENAHPTNNLTSSFYLRDASYIRLKSIDFGYTFPDHITRKLSVDKLRIYFSGSNLFLWDKIKMFDPEIENTSGEYYPQQRTLNIGVNLTF